MNMDTVAFTGSGVFFVAFYAVFVYYDSMDIMRKVQYIFEKDTRSNQ